MHIPDGYLSPSTCATLYAVSTPFWYASLQRVKKRLNARAVPLLSVFAAFSFVIMMFNLPLPGGTTGHAVGMGMASIVLGPWISILALSTALLVQALLFGDGGITTFGANCFNMAIAGSLVAYGAYRLIAFKAALTSSRRVVAAGIAGYAAINVAALCAAIELGVQPLFFHDASGAPIYAPYPLNVSIPAMMIGHLTFAGLGELIISAGIVAYLQRTSLNLLRTTAPDAAGNSRCRSRGNARKSVAGFPQIVDRTCGVLSADAVRNRRRGQCLGRMACQRLRRCRNSPPDSRGIGEPRASRENPRRIAAAFLLMESSGVRLCAAFHS